jgi:hypothetical protein
MKSNQQWRGESGNFVSLGNGKYGGYKKGVMNGPEPTKKVARNKENHKSPGKRR